MNLKHFFFLLLLVCGMHLHAEDSRARIFAFDLRTEIIDQVFYATFKCNTAFTEGKLHLYLPTVERITEAHTPALTVPFTPATVDIDGALVRVPIPEDQMTGDLATMLEVLNWAVELTGNPIAEGAELVEYTNPADENITFYCPQGIAINTNPYSLYFSNIYIAQAADGRPTDDADDTDDWYNAAKYERTKTQKKGIFVYNPVFEELNPANEGYLPSNIVLEPDWRHDLHRIAINPTNDNVAFAYRRSQAGLHSSIYEVRPRDMCAKNKRNINAIDVALGSPLVRTHSLCYDKEGALFVMDNTNVAYTPHTYATGKLYKQSDSEWELFVDGTTKGNLDINNKIVGLWPTMDNALAADGRDGVWVAQYRENFLKDTVVKSSKGEDIKQMDFYPILTHVAANGEVDFLVTQKSAEDTIRMFTHDGGIVHESGRGASGRGQLAYFEKENLLAFAGNKRVTLYRVTYDSNGKPTLTKWLATPEIAADIDGVAFDYVGNLYVLSHTTQRLYAFALPKEDNRSFVPAPRKVITIDEKKDNANSDAMKFYQSMPANSIVDVKLLRPFTNQYWQTLTLPFAMGEEQTQEVFGDGTDVAVMGHSYLKSSDWLYVRFDFIDSVQRAVPCLVLPTQVLTRGAVVHEQVLSLDVQTVSTNYAQMHGVLAPMDFNAFRESHPDDNFYFLAPNQLLSDNAADTMLALRAYFKFALSKEQLQNLRAKVVFEEEVSTNIESVVEEDSSCLPTKVLRNGQLIICRDGAEFTLQGQRLR